MSRLLRIPVIALVAAFFCFTTWFGKPCDAVELARVQEILRKNCHQCHGQKGSIEGGINYVLSAKRLVARGKVKPGKPGGSLLLERMKDGDMPPEDAPSRPTPEEIAIVEAWINEGAKSFGDIGPDRALITQEYILKHIRQDLEKTAERQRRFIRYFTIFNLYNAGFSNDELLTYRRGLSKLINSLSWNPRISIFTPVDSAGTIFRIDLRSYNWTTDIWEQIISKYPYGMTFDDNVAKQVRQWTDCDLPYVRADWFVANAAVPPLYHEILNLPMTDVELEGQLRVNVNANIEQETVIRAGFNGSGISRNNRLIERHESSNGAYWKSYDFVGNKGRQNLFAYPLGPDDDNDRSFRHAGGEIIFSLPNGMQAYLLIDAKGNRIDKAPTKIVSDPSRPDRAVENGLSCMSCHHTGLFDKADQIRPFVQNNPKAFSSDDRDLILALYSPRKDFQRAIAEDTKRFRDAVTRSGGLQSKSEPIVSLALQFEAELDLAGAAAEAGMSSKQFAASIRASALLSRKLGSLNVPGGSLQREVFNEAFRDIVREMKLGNMIDQVGELRRFEGHTKRVPIVVFSPDGNRFLTGSDDRYMRLWDANSGELIRRFTKHSHSVRAIAFSKDGRRAASATEDGMINLWDMQTDKIIRSFLAHKEKVYHLKYSNDGKWLMSSGMDAVIKRWNLVDTSQKPIVFRGHRSWVRSFDVSPDGKWFVSAGNDANILHWKMDSTVPLRQVAWAHKAPLSTIRLVPNSRFAATAGYDNGVKLFDLAVMRRVKIFDGHTGPVVSLDVSPDGRRIATVSNDKTLRLWSVGLGTEIIHFDSPDSMFDAVAFSPDGKKLATGSRNGIVHLWGLPRLSEAELEEQLPNFQDAGAEQNNSVMAVAGKLPLIEVLKPDDEPKWSVIPVDSAAKINGLRFMSPFKTDADMIFAFVVHPSNFSWNIAKADGSRMTTFRSFSKLSNVDFEGIDVPLENTTILQNHIGGHIKAGQEYVIWFKFPVRPSQFHAMVKLFPRTDKDKGSRQFIQQPRFVAKELGLAWPFKYKTTGFEFVPTNR